MTLCYDSLILEMYVNVYITHSGDVQFWLPWESCSIILTLVSISLVVNHHSSALASTYVMTDIVAIVGPNGIGKSTFLNLLMSKIEPVSL